MHLSTLRELKFISAQDQAESTLVFTHKGIGNAHAGTVNSLTFHCKRAFRNRHTLGHMDLAIRQPESVPITLEL